VKYKYPTRRRARRSPITRELREKHRLGLTLSPLDLCLRREIIDKDQHLAANHLIFLYRARYGLNQLRCQISNCYKRDAFSKNYIITEDDLKNIQDEYLDIVDLIKEWGAYDLVVNICIYDIFPSFLKEVTLSSGAFRERRLFVDTLREVNSLMIMFMQRRFGKTS
jgi:hypothetical protein